MDPAVRARLRAAAIAIVVVVHGWIAMPLPHRVTEGRMKKPESREELRRWQPLAKRLGIEMSDEELAAAVVEWSERISSGRQVPVKPLRPLLKVTGTGQGWALFAAPDTFPNRLEIHARIDGDWVPVYRRLDPTYTMLSSQLAFRRMRGVYDGTSLDGPYGKLAEWAADRVLAELPEADAVRVRLLRSHSTRPGARSDAKERPRQVKIVERT